MASNSRAHAAILTTYRILAVWGFDARKTVAALRGGRTVMQERREFVRQRDASPARHEFPMGPPYTIYADRHDDAGTASGHYFHQDLLVAREIHRRQPRRHIDVGSAIYGFVSHVASFRTIEVLDVRPVATGTMGITFVQQDVMALDPSFEAITDSASCLHALEHFGLGRYGDPVDFEGWRKGLDGLARMLEPDGTLYLSVPTSNRQRVEFNAHRVFALPFLRDLLHETFEIERLSFVDDDGNLIENVDPFGSDARRSFGAAYGCSIWILRKRSTQGAVDAA